MRSMIWFILFGSFLWGYTLPLHYSEKAPIALLPHAALYIDTNQSQTISTIAKQTFRSITDQSIGFGYAPKFTVWVRFSLTNHSHNPIQKILEYANPLTSHLIFYDSEKAQALSKAGSYLQKGHTATINPIFHLTIPAHQTKTYYLQIHSVATALIINLRLWQPDIFYQKELRHHFYLALFFGAIGMVTLYNLIVFLFTREKNYLYYVLFLASITLHQLLYTGIIPLYLLQPYMKFFSEYAVFVVAGPVFFLALFTQNILNLKQEYPRINAILTIEFWFFSLLILWIFFNHHNQYRSIPAAIILFSLFLITLYALYRGNRQARFIIVGWFLFFSTVLFMLLSSLGIYNIYLYFPYYTEVTLILQILILTLLLGDYIKQLQLGKLAMRDRLISYQEEEQSKLTTLVKAQTIDLEQSLSEKEILLEELNHRVTNSMQVIISFLRLQMDETHTEEVKSILKSIENRVFAINKFYTLLHTHNNIASVNAKEYFSLMIKHIQESFSQENITIILHTTLTLHSKEAIYCAFILNEAITNAYKHAFDLVEKGTIVISLIEKDDLYILTISDNGKGYDTTQQNTSLGLTIIETLATIQLSGTFTITAINGTTLTLSWRHHV